MQEERSKRTLKKQHNKELHNSYPSQNIIGMIKLGSLKWPARRRGESRRVGREETISDT
jgi:hypothetical protein